MGQENEFYIRNKLIMAVCFKAAKLGVPHDLDPLRIMRWLKNPAALEMKMQGALNFLRDDPESHFVPDGAIMNVEMAFAQFTPRRTVNEYMIEFDRANIGMDPFFSWDCFSSEIRPLNTDRVTLGLFATSFNRPATSAEADMALQSEPGVVPASFGQLCEVGIEATDFVRRLGMVVASGGDFETDYGRYIPYLTMGPTPENKLLLTANKAGGEWPANTWFLGVVPIDLSC